MRSSVLLLAALALTATRASADTGAVKTNILAEAKKDKTKQQAKGLPNVPAEVDSSPERKLLDPASSAIFQPTTSLPLTHLIAPIIGGVAGAAALAGVITLSVMKKPAPQAPSDAGPAFRAGGGGEAAAPALATTSLTRACVVGDVSIEVASTTGFGAGDTIKIGDEYQLVKGFGSIILDHPMNTAQAAGSVVSVVNDFQPAAPPASKPAPVPAAAAKPEVKAAAEQPRVASSSIGSDPSSGMEQSTMLAIASVLVVCGLLSVCIVALLYFCFGKKKKRKAQPRQEMMNYPEDQQPLNGVGDMSTMVDMQGAPDLCESQYMQVNVPPLQAAPAPFVANIGSVPTMQNVVPMQTMPPPPPMAMSYAPQASYQVASGSLFSQQGQSLFAPAPATGSLFSQGSYYQNASPLAMQTVNALPTQIY